MEAKQTRPGNVILTGIVFLVIIAGAGLMITFPVWIAPPNIASTVGLYLALLVLWIPLLIVLAVVGYRGPFVLLIGLGVVLVIIALALGGPNLSTNAIEAKDCTTQEISPGQTEYTCKGIIAIPLSATRGRIHE